MVNLQYKEVTRRLKAKNEVLEESLMAKEEEVRSKERIYKREEALILSAFYDMGNRIASQHLQCEFHEGPYQTPPRLRK